MGLFDFLFGPSEKESPSVDDSEVKEKTDPDWVDELEFFDAIFDDE